MDAAKMAVATGSPQRCGGAIGLSTWVYRRLMAQDQQDADIGMRVAPSPQAGHPSAKMEREFSVIHSKMDRKTDQGGA